MCLGIPGRIIEFADPTRHLARVDVSGVRRTIRGGVVNRSRRVVRARARDRVRGGDAAFANAVSRRAELQSAGVTLARVAGVGKGRDLGS